MDESKAKIEAILYCITHGVSARKIATTLNIGSPGFVKRILNEMQQEYENRGAGIRIVEKNGEWKFEVKEEYLNYVKEAAEPEIEKSVLETLGYIAWRKKILQSSLIKARSNKAYAHVKKLVELGFISAEPHGQTKRLKPTKKFYEYFKLKEGEKIELHEETEETTDI